jgi:L-ascorbate metabolism protein UlaG (beta-lactamase superfamily)
MACQVPAEHEVEAASSVAPVGDNDLRMRQLILAVLMIPGPFTPTGSVGHGAAAEDIRITPLIHASVQIEFGSQVIQVDPWSAGDLTRARPADLVLVTDDPGHHLDPGAIRQLRKPGAPVLMPAAAHAKFPDGTPIANGESTRVAGITVEAIPAYDIKPGEPSHPKGKANGYVITLGGTRIYVAGVTECVPEVRALRDIDVAFVPMNIPLERMTPPAAAACVNALQPRAVYVYHYDQDYAAAVSSGSARQIPLGGPHIATMSASVRAFRDALASSIEFRDADWYPVRPQR